MSDRPMCRREKEMMSGSAELQPGKEAGAPDSQSAAPKMKSKAQIALARVCSALLFIILLLSSSARGGTPDGSAQKNMIRLRKEAVLPGPNIALAEVAEVSGPEAQTLAKVDLGPVPWPGAKRLIDATVVKIKLFGENIDYTRVKITGNGCVVSTQTITVSGDEILDVARKLLMERLPWPEEEVQIEPETRPADREVAAGAERPALEASMAGGPTPAGKACVFVTGKAGGGPLFRTSVRFIVHVFKTVIVARRNISRGDTFNEDNLAGQRLDVSTLSPRGLYFGKETLIGKRAARAIRAGMPISRQVVVIPPVIKRGDLVQIVFKTSFLSLAARGISTESGAPGQMIRVRNIDSGREVIGQVTPAGQVSVSF